MIVYATREALMTPQRFARLKAALDRRQPDLTVLMDNVHKRHNLSAVMRTADAVGIMEVHAVSERGEVQRHRAMAGGSHKWVRTRLHPDVETAVSRLQETGHQVVAAHLSERAVDYRALDYTRPTALMIGSELHGLSTRGADLAEKHITVPMAGMVASLNVSVATGVILYEMQRQREQAGLYSHSHLEPAERDRLLFEWAYPEIARYCRRKGQPYPPLDEDGNLVP